MSRSREHRSAPPEPLSEETRAIDALTSVWMLAVANTLLCELAALVLALVARQSGSETAALLGGLLWLVALVIGVVSLILTAIVLRLRHTAPPRSVTAAALFIGSAPLVVWAVLWVLE
jgi:Ca2+/Na+ antiporter